MESKEQQPKRKAVDELQQPAKKQKREKMYLIGACTFGAMECPRSTPLAVLYCETEACRIAVRRMQQCMFDDECDFVESDWVEFLTEDGVKDIPSIDVITDSQKAKDMGSPYTTHHYIKRIQSMTLDELKHHFWLLEQCQWQRYYHSAKGEEFEIAFVHEMTPGSVTVREALRCV